MSKYDMIVVGAGPGGAATAYRAAKLGLKSLMIERGKFPGEKNASLNGMNGPYCDELMPSLRDMIPKSKLMWCIHRINIAFQCCLYKRGGMAKFQAFQMDEPDNPQPHGMYMSLRNQWDKWFADVVLQEEGVELMNSTLVVDVIRDGAGAVKGVITDKGERIEAPITIAADGTNSIVARKAGLRGKYHLGDVVMYAQMLYELGPNAPEAPPEVGIYDFIETEEVNADECGCGNVWSVYLPNIDGKRYLHLGGGGMMQPGGTNPHIRTNAWYLLRRIGQHITLKPYIDKSTLVYMDCKMSPAMVELGKYGPTYGDGIMVVGDAAIGTIWQGLGVHATWEAAIEAAEVAKKAIDKGDVSAKVLKEYEDRWKQKPWVVDAAMEPYFHGLWRKDEGFAPFIKGLVRATPEMENRPGHGIVQAHGEYIRDVIFPTLANMGNMAPGLKVALESAGVDPAIADNVSKSAKGGKK